MAVLLTAVFAWQGNRGQAAVGINKQINFQGKIVNTNGTNISNGTYNMEFKIYCGGDGTPGTTTSNCNNSTQEQLLWTEDRLVGGTGGVTITDGMFQVSLGSVTSLPGSVDFNNDKLWLSLNIGNTSSCTVTTSFVVDCSGDGEMNPMVRFTAVPYSFNADLLDGVDSTAFGQLASNQTWTGTQTLQPTTNISSAIVKQTSVGSPTADIFDVQTANNTNIIQVTGPAANEAAVTIQSVGATRQLTLQSGSGTISLGTTTTLSSSGALSINSGGSSGLTLNSASGRVSVATGDFLSLGVSGVSGAAAGDIWYDTAASKFKINEGGTTKTLCNTTDAGCGSGGSTTLQTAYDADTDGSNATIQLTSADDSVIIQNPASGGTDSGYTLFVEQLNTGAVDGLRVASAGTGLLMKVTDSTSTAQDVFTIADEGAAVFKNRTDSTTAFSVQKTGTGVDLFVIDSTNSRVYVGDPTADSTGVLLVLDTKNTSGDPTGVNGGLYYNSNDNDFRAYHNSNWANIQPLRYAFLSADRTNSTTSYADVTDLSFSVAASTNYEVVCSLVYQTAATTTGIGFALNGPASPGLVTGTFASTSAATTASAMAFNAYNGGSATTGVQTANANTYGTFKAYFRNGSTAGTLQLRFKSEVASSNAVVKANSYCTIAEL